MGATRRRRQGSGKWAALFWASLTVLRKHPMLDVTLKVDGEARSASFLPKPFGVDEFLARVREILDSRSPVRK